MLIGSHQSVAGGVSQAFARAERDEAAAIQIFTKTARAWAGTPLEDEERRRFRQEARRTQLPTIAHGSYLTNLATTDPGLRERSIACVLDELTRCERLGIRHLVIHPGTHEDERLGLRQVARALDEVHRATRGFRSRICLEGTAGQGNCLGHRFEHLAELLQLTERGDRLSICLDTCHLFAAGYDISSKRGYERVMAEFEQQVGIERVACFHLNDCKKPLGCRVDRHEEIGKGNIGLAAFRCLVNDPRFEQTVGVLETPHPERYGHAIRLLRSLREK